MKLIIFSAMIILICSGFANAQNTSGKDNPGNSVKSYHSYQELYNNLVDEYGLKDIQFVKVLSDKYLPEKSDGSKSTPAVQISQDVIVIFAIIGAVLVGLILLKSL